MFGGGGGGMNPRKMQQMMEQMGIDVEQIDAEEVVIRTAEEEYVFTDAEVQKMDAQGQATYQIMGEADTRPRGESEGAIESGQESDDEASDDGGSDGGIPDADIEIVAQRTGVSESDAREALVAEDGDLAAAVERLE